jgi:methionyl-tRNA formyltransferase
MEQIKIGYFADGPWSHQALEKFLLDSTIGIEFICARHDKPDLTLKEQAEIHGIDFISHPKINSDEFFQKISGYNSNLFVSMSFNQIFRKRLIEYPKLKTINCHAGKLPFYRGRNILNWALINDEKEFGITVHYMDEGIDTGDILMQRLFRITDSDNYATLLKRAYSGSAELLFETVEKLASGEITSKPQVDMHPLGFYCTGRVDGDERLQWNQPSRDIFNFVRAICNPGPEARTFCENIELKINRVELLSSAPIYKGIPGAILEVCSNGFYVKTADTYLKVTEWSGIDRVQIGKRLE